MTIYVWSNGDAYEDHRIHFIETNHPLDVVEAAMRTMEPDGGVIMYATEPTWIGFDYESNQLHDMLLDAVGLARLGLPDGLVRAVGLHRIAALRNWSERAKARGQMPLGAWIDEIKTLEDLMERVG